MSRVITIYLQLVSYPSQKPSLVTISKPQLHRAAKQPIGRTIPIPISFNCNFIRASRRNFAPATVQFFVQLGLPQREMHRRQFRPSPANLFSPRDKLVSRGPIRLFDSFLRFRPEGGEGATPGVSQGVLRALLSNRRLSSVSPLINIYAVLPNTWSHSRDHRRSGSFSVPPVFNYTAIFAAPSYSPRR